MKDELHEIPEEMLEETDVDVVSILKRMQQQLAFLEKKIDILVHQAQEKPAREESSHDRPFRKKAYARPARPYERSERYGRGDREHGSRDRDSAPGHFYDRHRPEKKRTAAPKKRPYAFPRKDRD